MRAIDWLHRWTGGLIGLLLALLGLSGAILLHKDAWIALPHAGDAQAQDPAALARQLDALTAAAAAEAPRSAILATRDFGLTRLNFADERGAYIDQAGGVVARWDSVWDRPELWLFDFHHHLLTGETGETVSGIAGLIGLAFVITGAILWWTRRKSFALRAWPRRMTRPAILRHHRDLGIVAAPLLLLSMLTGTMMVLRPVADLVLSPWSSAAEMRGAAKPPTLRAGPLAARPDWAAIVTAAKARYPGAELRVVALPAKPGEPIAIRLRQDFEWLPNGRSMAWFDPADGRLLAARGAEELPSGTKVFNLAYPLHAAKVGGLGFRLVMTVSGLALAMLGSFAVWSFWFRRKPAARDGSRRRNPGLDLAVTPAA